MTAATIERHRHRKPSRRRRLPADLARDIWRLATRRRRARRLLIADLKAAAAPVYGPETIAQAAARERGFDPIHHAPPPLLARKLEAAAYAGTLAELDEPECPWSHMDSGQHDSDYYDGGRCSWCGTLGPLAAWEPLPPATGPVPAAMDDPAPAEDDVWPMDRGPLRDWLRDSFVMRALDKEGRPR